MLLNEFPQVVADTLSVMAIEYVGVVLAVGADLISGLRKARREGQRCSSRGLRRSVSKLTSYFLLMFCLYVVDGMILAALTALRSLGRTDLPAPFPWLTSAGAISLALIELLSILENSPHRLPILNSLSLLLNLFRKNSLRPPK